MRLLPFPVIAGILALSCAASASLVGGEIEGRVFYNDFNSPADFGTVAGVRAASRAGMNAALLAGSTSCIEVADDPKMHMPSGMTLAMWIRPEAVSAVQVPLVVKEGSWGLYLDENAAVNFTLTGTPESSYVSGGFLRPMGTWLHLAVTYDGNMVRCYLDGKSFHPGYGYKVKTSSLAPGGPLRIGWRNASAADISPIAMDDVVVFDRALSESEVRRLCQQTASETIEVKPFIYYFADEIVAQLKYPGRVPSRNARAEVSLRIPGDRKPLKRVIAELPRGTDATEVTLNVGKLTPGEYELAADALTTDLTPVGLESVTSVVWPERPVWEDNKKAKVLNAVVAELLNQSPATRNSYGFTNPRRGWVFFSLKAADSGMGASVRATIEPAPPGGVSATLVDAKGSGIFEAMRFLPKGDYIVRLSPRNCRISNLTVRAVPEIGSRIPCKPNVPEYGIYGWEFLADNTTPNLNLTTTYNLGVYPSWDSGLRQWLADGKKFNKDRNPVGMDTDAARQMTPQQGAKLWAEVLSRSDIQSVTLDEISDPESEMSKKTTEALRLLAPDWQTKFPGKGINIYCYGHAGMYRTTPGAQAFLKAVADCGGHLVHELYISDEPTEAEARSVIDTCYTSFMATAKRLNPNAPAESTLLPSLMMWPGYSGHDMYPDVDYRAFLEMQVRAIATQSEFFGLHGIGVWGAPNADEEAVRFWGQLMRHYFIEGRTGRLLKDPYMLSHVSNPAFDDGTSGWTLASAEPGSVFLSSSAKCGRVIEHWVQYGATTNGGPDPMPGDNVLVLKKSAANPNLVSQTIRNLEPGRLYSLRFWTADYDDLCKAKAEGKTLAETPARAPAITATIDGAEIVSGKSFVSHTLAGYVGGKYGVYFCGMNFHRMVFKATAKQMKLQFTDQSAGTGKQNLLTFVKVQPYWSE